MAKYVRQEPETLWTWLVQLGLPGLGIGVGMTMTGYINFWAGMGLAGACTLLFAIHWRRISKQQPKHIRLFGYAIPCAFAVYLIYMTMRPIHADISLSAEELPYQAGSVVAGIKWQDSDHEMRVFLSNGSNESYANINVLIRTDAMIRQIGWLSKLTQCAAEPTLGPIQIASGSMTMISEDGKKVRVPLSEPQAGNMFKVLCDKVLPEETLQIIIAASAPIGAQSSSTNPKWITAEANFDAFGRSRTLRTSKCFDKACPDMKAP